MIWQSVPVMTAIDLLIVLATVHLMHRVVVNRRILAEIGVLASVWVAMSGLILIALLYAVDLATMYVMPTFSGYERAMATMTELHLNWSWVVILVGVLLLVSGLSMFGAFNDAAARHDHR